MLKTYSVFSNQDYFSCKCPKFCSTAVFYQDIPNRNNVGNEIIEGNNGLDFEQ